MTDLFIGVVSHDGSRFALNQGENGLAFTLARALDVSGVSCEVAVNTHNNWTPELLDITSGVAVASARASLAFEQAWQRYLDEETPSPFFTRSRKYSEFRVRRWALGLKSRRKSFGVSSIASVRRLANIELSHVDLWQKGVASGARWVLILEDDGGCADIDDLAGGLKGLLTSTSSSASADPFSAATDFIGEGGIGRRYVNISASFESHQLGVDYLLSSTPLTWSGAVNRDIQASSRPITNTVCAILYNAELLALILEKFADMRFSPVIPIDFKLNAALISLFRQGQLGDGDCLQVQPAPIVQMSMHEMG